MPAANLVMLFVWSCLFVICPLVVDGPRRLPRFAYAALVLALLSGGYCLVSAYTARDEVLVEKTLPVYFTIRMDGSTPFVGRSAVDESLWIDCDKVLPTERVGLDDKFVVRCHGYTSLGLCWSTYREYVLRTPTKGAE